MEKKNLTSNHPASPGEGGGPLYFDYQATTACDPRVIQAMMPYFQEKFGNPHSRNHAYGWDAEKAVEDSRAQIAKAIHADPKEIVFTSGATESNNLAIKGLASFLKRQREDGKNHIITTNIEHKCVLETVSFVKRNYGFQVTFLPVEQDGILSLDRLREAITDRTALVSVLAVSNEIGVVQPLKEIGELCRAQGVFFHTDAAQALGKIPLNVKDQSIDMLSLSGHKIYGPKGVGVLYVGKKPRVRLDSLFSGGGQERGMRSGTLAPFLCVGMGTACELAEASRPQECERIRGFYQTMKDRLFKELPRIFLNGSETHRVPHNLNISFSCVEGESLMMALKDLALSSGSACTSASLEPSYVLKALGVSEELAHTSLRISFGRYTTQDQVDYATQRIIEEVNKLRNISPLWEMIQEGVDLSTIHWTAH